MSASNESMPQPRRVETEVVARCAYCKEPLYVERYDERFEDGKPVGETLTLTPGDPTRLQCHCSEAREKREQQQ